MRGLQLGIERAAGLPLAAAAISAPALALPQVTASMPTLLPAQAAPATGQPAPTIHITINLNGPASPQAAQDVAAAVRREVGRALAEAARRDALARRATMLDAGLA